MHTIRVVYCLSLALIVCFAAPIAHAQEAAPPAYLSAVSGAATIERDGELEPAVVNMPLVEGDILRTADGGVQVIFPDGSAIDIEPDSEVEMLGATRVRVVRGAMEHRAAEPADTPSVSADYLPQELRTYGSTLDDNGSWQYQAPYGYVWYPSVAADWRPYYYGSWSAVPAYGWTWVGVDAWSWPTHHYGRWGYSRNAWFWIPGRTWSAAWVSWASASDYVSWCPLGFDGRPVFALSAGYNRGWNGWTVLSRGHFGARGVYAPHYSVDPRRIASDTPFIEHSRAPMAAPRYARQSSVGGSQVAAGNRRSPGATRQPAAASRQSPVVTPPSSDGTHPAAIDRQQPILVTPGHAAPRIGNAPPPVGRRDMSVPRYQAPRSEIPRPEAVPTIPPSRAQVAGEPAAHGAERARPATGYQAPPAAYRPPPTATAPPAGSRPSQGTAAAPAHAAPIAPPAPAHAAPAQAAPAQAAPRSGGDSGHASRASAGGRGPR